MKKYKNNIHKDYNIPKRKQTEISAKFFLTKDIKNHLFILRDVQYNVIINAVFILKFQIHGGYSKFFNIFDDNNVSRVLY